jgi:hypothetical protein
MPTEPTPVSKTLHEAFASELMPLLRRIGFAATKPQRVKPGLVAAMAARPLADGGRLEVCLWCNGGTGHALRFRVDRVSLMQGVECFAQVDLKVPWPDAAAPRPASLDFSGKEFLPGEGIDQLRKAISFLAGAFAACHQDLARAIPEVASELREASAEPAWRAAMERAADLWRTRHMRGEVSDRRVSAEVLFVGANLVTVLADGERLTFRLDTRDFDRTAAIWVSGWHLTPAATRRALRLTAGGTTWHFDPGGALLRTSRDTATSG